MTAENRKPRLRRLSQSYIRSPIYFVTACTNQRKQLLAAAVVHETFVRFGEKGPNYDRWIGDYVLMPDHLHAFLAMDEERINLAAWGKSLKNTISKALRLAGVASPHWEKTFFDHVLRTSESYSSKWECVRSNPVRAGLVERPEDWRFMGRIYDLEFQRD